MSKKALLVISFGTSYPETRKKTIAATEDTLKKAYPEHDFYRAFTSRMIVSKLKKRDNEVVDLPTEALQKLKDAGYTEVICQTTHIINGHEYDITLKELKAFENDFDVLTLGKPLLTSVDDYKRTIAIVMEALPQLKAGEALLYMGHGSEHHANAVYPCLDYMFKSQGHKNVYMGTVEGFPELDDIMPQLKEKGYKKIYLAPFMLVAGDHAQNDLAGDEEDSWNTLLKEQGFETQVILEGLGEYPGIQALFLEHLNAAKSVKEM
ncbi:sirohydrochlorin cobaltochelatase [Eubacteriaceae bacterium ES2]|nr:sirohydrochlorin cobaltochelatase [Eubacteriaceae bacterium ES2]